MKLRNLLKTYLPYVSLVLISVILILVGSFKDLEISQSSFKPENGYSKVMGLIAGLPAYTVFGGTGVLFFISWRSNKANSSKFFAILCLIIYPILSGLLYGYQTLTEYFMGDNAALISSFVGIGIIAALEVLFYFFVKDLNSDDAYNAGIIFLIVSAFVMVLVFLLKTVSFRPRYITIDYLAANNKAEGGEAAKSVVSYYYRDWWEFDASIKEAYPSIDGSYFESWPSGHTSTASLTILYLHFCRIDKRMKGKEFLVYGFSLVFTFMVGLGRILDGKHYLSDVAFGAFFSYLYTGLLLYLFERRYGEKQYEQIDKVESRPIGVNSISKPYSFKGPRKFVHKKTLHNVSNKKRKP